MGLLGDLLSAPVRIVNAPIRAVEILAGSEDKDDGIASAPLEALAKALEEVDED